MAPRNAYQTYGTIAEQQQSQSLLLRDGQANEGDHESSSSTIADGYTDNSGSDDGGITATRKGSRKERPNPLEQWRKTLQQRKSQEDDQRRTPNQQQHDDTGASHQGSSSSSSSMEQGLGGRVSSDASIARSADGREVNFSNSSTSTTNRGMEAGSMNMNIMAKEPGVKQLPGTIYLNRRREVRRDLLRGLLTVFAVIATIIGIVVLQIATAKEDSSSSGVSGELTNGSDVDTVTIGVGLAAAADLGPLAEEGEEAVQAIP